MVKTYITCMDGTEIFTWNQLVSKYIYIYICIYIHVYMGVSKNSGTPKWMVYNGNPYFFNG